MRQQFNNLALRKKIFLIFTVSVLLLATLFNLSLTYLMNQYNQEIYATNAQLLTNVTTVIESQMSAIEDMSNYIIGDETIQENLVFLNDNPYSSKRALASRDIYQSLYPYIFSNDYIQSINILNDDFEIAMGTSLDPEAIDIPQGNAMAIKQNGRIQWLGETTSGPSIYCVRVIRQRKYLKLTSLAVLYIKVDLDQIIKDALDNAGYPPTETNFILYKDDILLYPQSTPYEFNVNALSLQDETYLIDTIEGSKKFIISGDLDTVSWHYYYIRDYNRLFKKLMLAKTYSVMAIILCSFIVLILTEEILKSMFKHIDRLLQKIQNFGKGLTPSEGLVSEYTNRTDEIGRLHQHFDTMTRSVTVLRDANYEKQLHLKDATIKILEQQINPHFLYNTLDMINWMAQVEGAQDISTVVLSLGKLFRASISMEKDLIPLEQELTFLKSYIKIQKIRFNERLNFTIDISDDLLNMMIPKLSLQPLVENAIKHGMESLIDTCYIALSAAETEQDYILTLSNTGSIFDNDLLNRIKNNDLKPLGTGVGLTNIDSRLKLLFGNEYGLKFDNRDSKACVIMRIPKTYIPHLDNSAKSDVNISPTIQPNTD